MDQHEHKKLARRETWVAICLVIALVIFLIFSVGIGATTAFTYRNF